MCVSLYGMMFGSSPDHEVCCLFSLFLPGLRVEEGWLGVDEAEGESVVGCDAIVSDGLTVCFGGITFVYPPSVLRVLSINTHHIFVTVCLREDRCCGDAHHLAVAFHYALMGNTGIRLKSVTVNQQIFRFDGQRLDGAVHRKKRCVEYVYLVNLLRGNNTHRPSKCITLDNRSQCVALLLRQLFGVVEQLVCITLREYYSRSKDRTRQASASRLVAPCFDASLNKIRQ